MGEFPPNLSLEGPQDGANEFSIEQMHHRPVQKLDCIEQGDFPHEIAKGPKAVGIRFEIAR